VADDELMAATRDASWTDRPNTRSVKQFHIVLPGTKWLPACNPSNMLLDSDESARPAAQVPVPNRCRRPGCKVRWPQ
jgi:hypothetical protein